MVWVMVRHLQGNVGDVRRNELDHLLGWDDNARHAVYSSMPCEVDQALLVEALAPFPRLGGHRRHGLERLQVAREAMADERRRREHGGETLGVVEHALPLERLVHALEGVGVRRDARACPATRPLVVHMDLLEVRHEDRLT